MQHRRSAHNGNFHYIFYCKLGVTFNNVNRIHIITICMYALKYRSIIIIELYKKTNKKWNENISKRVFVIN